MSTQFTSSHATAQTAASATISVLRHKRTLLIFLLLTSISIFYATNQSVNAQSGINSSDLNGTIPPGGTIPAPQPDATQGQVRVLHLAPFATDLNDTEIDICKGVGDPVAGLTGLFYLQTSGYLFFPPGTYDWFVGTPGCATMLLDLPPFLLARGSVSTLLIVGGANSQPLNSIFLIDQLGQVYQRYLPIINRP